MPIATRAKVQSEIPFPCRKTRSQDSSTKSAKGNTKKIKTKKKCMSAASNAMVDNGQAKRQGQGKVSRQTRTTGNKKIESSSGEWAISKSPRKRRASAKEDTPLETSCSPSKIKKENVPAANTEQHPSPRKNFQNGGILKDVQNSPLKDRRKSVVGDVVESAYNDTHSGGDNSLLQSRIDLVLPVSPRKKMASSHKRALTFNFQDEPEQSCSVRGSPRKMPTNENSPLVSTQDSTLLASPSKVSKSRRKSVALGLQRQNGECYQKAKRALHTSVPDRLLCRDKEVKAISTFLQEHLSKKKPASMYISGAPGTGKTACLSSIMREKKDLVKTAKTIYINCMSVKQSQHIYNKVLGELCQGHEPGKVKAKEVVAKIEKEFCKSGPMVLLVMDEIDHLDSKNQEVLYTMFEWPTLKKSRLVLIGIANALDLTDRILPRLQARPRCKPKLLHFAPYTKDQISTILKDRLSEATENNDAPIVDPMAVQFCARKVAAVAGDIRKALDVCRRAVELVENDVCRQTVLKANGSPRKCLNSSPRKSLQLSCTSPRKSPRKALLTSPRKSPSKPKTPAIKKVGLLQISNVISEVYGSRLTASSGETQTFPLQQKLIICTVLLIVKKGKIKEVTLGKLHDTYSQVCIARQMEPVDQSECLSLCQLIETGGILGLKKHKDARQTKVSLKLAEKELEFALQDKVLVSSILKDGLPSKKK